MRKISLSKLNKIDEYFNQNKTQLISKIVQNNPDLNKKNFPKLTRKQWESRLGAMFRQDVEDVYTKRKVTLNTAIKRHLHSEAFVSEKQRIKENLITRVKQDKEVYSKVRNMFRKQGKFGAINLDNINYTGKVEHDGDVYSEYEISTDNGKGYIYTTQSPKGGTSTMFFSREKL